MVDNDAAAAAVRIDRWLWAARFFKTRGLAAEAVNGGKVHINGARVKPAKSVAVGDELQITRGSEHFVITVLGLSDKRGPAKQAALLYEETDDSRQRRESERAMRRVIALSNPTPEGRPDKKTRRQIRRLSGKE